jgi:8-oxo-dGTP pyrophosphatase MutT (NUDIX family)
MNIKVLWEDKLTLDKIKWGHKLASEYKLISKLDLKRKINWLEHVKQKPTDYDGKLVFLDNFHYEENELILEIGSISFSTVIFMEKKNLHVDRGIGMLGVQCLIFSPCQKYILVGERSKSETYYPGITTLPGGMLECDDLKTSPEEALMREIYEETPFLFKPKIYLNAIISGWNNISVTFLIVSTIKEVNSFNPRQVIIGDKEEWENNLRWLRIEDLKNYPSNKILDGLYYYQRKVSKC